MGRRHSQSDSDRKVIAVQWSRASRLPAFRGCSPSAAMADVPRNLTLGGRVSHVRPHDVVHRAGIRRAGWVITRRLEERSTKDGGDMRESLLSVEAAAEY